MNARRILSALLLCVLMTAGASATKFAREPDVDLSQHDFRSGDIVFQHLPGKLGSVICEVTDSPLSHCGMVVDRKGELHVIEAIGPVRYISLKKWLKQGDRGRFTQLRLKGSLSGANCESSRGGRNLPGAPLRHSVRARRPEDLLLRIGLQGVPARS